MNEPRCLYCELMATLSKFMAEVGPSGESVLDAIANLTANVILTWANGDHELRTVATEHFARLVQKHVRECAGRQYRESKAGRA